MCSDFLAKTIAQNCDELNSLQKTANTSRMDFVCIVFYGADMQRPTVDVDGPSRRDCTPIMHWLCRPWRHVTASVWNDPGRRVQLFAGMTLETRRSNLSLYRQRCHSSTSADHPPSWVLSVYIRRVMRRGTAMTIQTDQSSRWLPSDQPSVHYTSLLWFPRPPRDDQLIRCIFLQRDTNKSTRNSFVRFVGYITTKLTFWNRFLDPETGPEWLRTLLLLLLLLFLLFGFLLLSDFRFPKALSFLNRS